MATMDADRDAGGCNGAPVRKRRRLCAQPAAPMDDGTRCAAGEERCDAHADAYLLLNKGIRAVADVAHAQTHGGAPPPAHICIHATHAHRACAAQMWGVVAQLVKRMKEEHGIVTHVDTTGRHIAVPPPPQCAEIKSVVVVLLNGDAQKALYTNASLMRAVGITPSHQALRYAPTIALWAAEDTREAERSAGLWDAFFGASRTTHVCC